MMVFDNDVTRVSAPKIFGEHSAHQSIACAPDICATPVTNLLYAYPGLNTQKPSLTVLDRSRWSNSGFNYFVEPDRGSTTT